MTGLEIWLLAIGLAMDCLAVSIASGIILKRIQWRPMLVMAFFFGLFQDIMPLLGWLGASTFSHLIESVDHWVAFILLGYIGGKMVYDAVKEAKSHEPKECRDPISFKMLMVMAIATSIDALATGIILPSVVGASTLLLMLTAVGLIGLTTFIISFAGVYIGKKFGDLFSSKAELLGGLVLIIIGCKILIEHLF